MAAVGQQPQLPPAKQNERSKPAVTQLEFHQAMMDFKTMFPEMDVDVIEVVLRANNGAVDATIDQLLSMSTDNENERLRAEWDATENDELPPSYSPATPPPSYQQAVPYAHSRLGVLQLGRKSNSASPSLMRHAQLQSQKFNAPSSQLLPPAPKISSSLKDSSASKSEVQASQQKKRWNPPLLGPLPANFLRLDDHPPRSTRRGRYMTLSSAMLQKRMQENERQRRNTIGAEDPELARYLEDERIALFLQNEEFVRELMGNKEFRETLEKDAASDNTATLPAKHSLSSKNVEKVTGAESSKPEEHSMFAHASLTDDTDAAFRERLKNMGKLSKRKFAQLASIFSRRKRAFKPILGDGINPSRDNLLSHEDEYSELSEDDSDTDWNKTDSWNSHKGDLGERSTMKHSHKQDHS